MDAVDTLYANTRNNPIEDIESHLPLRVARYELREGASGAGEWRGDLGSVREFVYLADGGASVEGEGHAFAPWGLDGGRPGNPAELRLVRQDGTVEKLPSKVPHMQIRAGERFVCVGPAGGGYGDPFARKPERVGEDVADGLLAKEAARRDYGIVLTAGGAVDEAETAYLRAEMPGTRGASIGCSGGPHLGAGRLQLSLGTADRPFRSGASDHRLSRSAGRPRPRRGKAWHP
jgi:N-methylhydantoinase B